MAQQASPNMSGQTEDRRPQLYRRSSVVTVTASWISCGMSYWGKLSFSLSMDVLLEPVLVDCVQDVIVRKRRIILEFRECQRPFVNLLQTHSFKIDVSVLTP